MAGDSGLCVMGKIWGKDFWEGASRRTSDFIRKFRCAWTLLSSIENGVHPEAILC
jgi:hypothetical protein